MYELKPFNKLPIVTQFNLLQNKCDSVLSLMKNRQVDSVEWNQLVVDNCKELYTMMYSMGLVEYMDKHPDELKKLLDKRYIDIV